MANKVRGDYELDGLALELIGKLSSLHKGNSVEKELTNLMGEGNFEELWRRIVAHSGTQNFCCRIKCHFHQLSILHL